MAAVLLAAAFFVNPELFKGAFPGARRSGGENFPGQPKIPNLPKSARISEKDLKIPGTGVNTNLSPAGLKELVQNQTKIDLNGPPPRERGERPPPDRLLRIRRTILDPAREIDAAHVRDRGFDLRLADYEMCATGGGVKIQSLSIVSDGEGPSIPVRGILVKPDRGRPRTQLFNIPDMYPGRRVEVAATDPANPDLVLIRPGSCANFIIELQPSTDRSKPAIDPTTLWQRFSLTTLVTNPTRIERYDVPSGQFVEWISGSGGILSWINVFIKEHKLFLNKWPQQDGNAPRDTPSFLGNFVFQTNSNDDVTVGNVTLQVAGDFTESLLLGIEANMYGPETSYTMLVNRDAEVTPGQTLSLPINRRLKFGETLIISYFNRRAPLPNTTNSIRLAVTGIEVTPRNIFNGERGSWDHIPITLPYTGSAIYFADRPSLALTVEFNGEFVDAADRCRWYGGEYLSQYRIQEATPDIYWLGFQVAGDLRGTLQATPTFHVSGDFSDAVLEFYNTQTNAVHPNDVFTLNPIDNVNWLNLVVKIRQIRPMPGSVPITIKIDLTNLTLSRQDIPITFQHWNCETQVRENIALPYGSLLIHVENPSIYETSRYSPARPQVYPVGYRDTPIKLFEACFESYPGNSDAKGYIFQHNSGKDMSPFGTVRLETAGMTHILSSWDRNFAQFIPAPDATVRDRFSHNGNKCIQVFGENPQVPLRMNMMLTELNATAAETTQPYLPVFIAGDQRLGTPNQNGTAGPIPGVPIEITGTHQ